MELSKNFSEIERKFLLKGGIPSTPFTSTTVVHRHYLHIDHQAEMRIQSKGENSYELERKVLDSQSPLRRWSMKASITADEFQNLKKSAIGNQISYLKHSVDMPGIAIKEYLDQLAGLIIVEVEFADLQTAQVFRPSQSWIGREITEHAYARDSGLIRIASFDELAAQLSQ